MGEPWSLRAFLVRLIPSAVALAALALGAPVVVTVLLFLVAAVVVPRTGIGGRGERPRH